MNIRSYCCSTRRLGRWGLTNISILIIIAMLLRAELHVGIEVPEGAAWCCLAGLGYLTCIEVLLRCPEPLEMRHGDVLFLKGTWLKG